MWAGESYPLGATYDGAATNFSPYSERAERVELCLIAKDGSEDRVNLDEVDGFVWTGIELLAHRCSRARENRFASDRTSGRPMAAWSAAS